MEINEIEIQRVKSLFDAASHAEFVAISKVIADLEAEGQTQEKVLNIPTWTDLWVEYGTRVSNGSSDTDFTSVTPYTF
jgi:hypothetical protein|tara:strand:- start:3 stop:236 length:234 start_codon:yes stop_codon:yes gene_type:complete